MLGVKSFKLNKDKVFALLEDFEEFCLGKKYFSPEQFTIMNEELSLSAVLSIGKSHLEHRKDGNHMVWIAPGGSEHDLGPVEKLGAMRAYPGFHRTRSLLLGQEQVEGTELVHVPFMDRYISMVKMKDGSIGYGPNYKIALRNAALKMELKKEFIKANPLNLWKMFYGNA